MLVRSPKCEPMSNQLVMSRRQAPDHRWLVMRCEVLRALSTSLGGNVVWFAGLVS